MPRTASISLSHFSGMALLLSLLAACAPQGPSAPAGGSRIEPAIILIEVTHQRPNWFTPWQNVRPEQSTGSGFLIAPGRVMTNAHVVSDAKQIIVRRNEGKRPFFAQVEFIAHDSDLAILKVDDPKFSQGVVSLEIGGLPSLRSHVRTYGYPAGGEKISRTEGVVSRIQFITYLHSGADSHLGIQTDSAINPGNSGGPVIQEGKVVGVAFQANTQLNDVGYFIPTPVIRRFMGDIQDGDYQGYGDLGVITSNLLNPNYRSYLGLPDNEQGVIVDQVLPGSSADGNILPHDVLLAVDGIPILSDGTITYHGYSMEFTQIVEEKLVGQPVELTVWRKNQRRTLRFPLQRYTGADRMRSQYDAPPSYFIFAGLVFMELNQEYLKTFGNFWENADRHLLYTHFYSHLENNSPLKKQVVLGRVLPDRVNSAYQGMINYLVESINGVTINTLHDIPKGLAASQDQYHRFKLQPGDMLIVLDKATAGRAHPEILARYGIDRAERLP